VGLGRTLLLGLIAGGTILLGMPLGRLRRPVPSLRAMLNAIAVGVLLFLVWDVLSAAWEPIDAALASVHDGKGGLGAALGYGILFATGLTVGLLGLVGYERWLARTAAAPAKVSSERTPGVGPGTMAAGELTRPRGLAGWSPARRLALLIAVGIGLHNFAEGLAIGQSAASGEISLAALLVIGFALHNATEGFGIVAPLAAEQAAGGASGKAGGPSGKPGGPLGKAGGPLGKAGGPSGKAGGPLGKAGGASGKAVPGQADDVDTRPSWAFLLTLAAIGGGPTALGAAVGHSFTSQALAVAFLTLAAGSIIYVVIQLLALAGRTPNRTVVATGVLIGLLAGFATDAIVSAAGV